jgi:hypothetical protein
MRIQSSIYYFLLSVLYCYFGIFLLCGYIRIYNLILKIGSCRYLISFCEGLYNNNIYNNNNVSWRKTDSSSNKHFVSKCTRECIFWLNALLSKSLLFLSRSNLDTKQSHKRLLISLKTRLKHHHVGWFDFSSSCFCL